MAKTLQQLQAEHKTETDAAQAILDKAGDAELTKEQTEAFNGHLAKAKGLQTQIEQRQSLAGHQEFSRTPSQRVTEQEQPQLEGDGAGVSSLNKGASPKGTAIEIEGLRLSLPKGVYRRGKLKSFNEPNGEYLAYGFGMWMLSTFAGQQLGQVPQMARNWCADHGLRMQAADPRDWASLAGQHSGFEVGGFTVPDQYDARLIRLVEEYGTFRQYAERVPLTGDTYERPIRTGGLTAYFTSDQAEADITESRATGTLAIMNAKTLATLTPVGNNLNEDAVISWADFIFQEIAFAFANKEDECGWNGDGSDTYGGIQGVLTKVLAGSVYDAITAHTAFSTLTMADFEGMLGKAPSYVLKSPNAAWYIHSAGYYASMKRLENASGGTTATEIQNGQRSLMFCGFPVRFVQVLNSTLSAQVSTKLLAFGDLNRAAMFGDRKGTSLAMSEHVYFKSNRLGIRGLERFDINYHSPGTATVAGPIIVLKTPAS